MEYVYDYQTKEVKEAVVRCRDCIHCETWRDGLSLCGYWSDVDYLPLTDPSSFCSNGRRKKCSTRK